MKLTLVQVNPDMSCLCKQCRSRSVGFLKKPTDLDLHCLPFSIWIYINNLDQVIWLAENIRIGRGILIYSAGNGLIIKMQNIQDL